METLRAQIAAITDEIQVLKNEMVQTKSAHATLHQSAVDRNAETLRRFTDIGDRLNAIASDTGTHVGQGKGYKKSLIEPKQVTVTEFAGAVSDSRSKFLMWGEKVKDRAQLFDDELVEAMNKAEASTIPITAEMSAEWGITKDTSKELHGFLKDRCTGTAEAIVRSNKTGVGLESWRMLSNQFNPRTLAGALSAQDKELRPKGAKSISQMPNALLEWEKDLRRCIAEGRTPPDDRTKRLALLRMLPPNERKTIWPVANQLYPDFAPLLNKIQEMVQDEFDEKHNQMDVDHIEDDDGKWESTGQTLVGKDGKGEEVLFSLQRRGNSTRVVPKGKSKGKGKTSTEAPRPTGKSSKWVKGGCARCGRGSHWARECTATTDVDGTPLEKNRRRQREAARGG